MPRRGKKRGGGPGRGGTGRGVTSGSASGSSASTAAVAAAAAVGNLGLEDMDIVDVDLFHPEVTAQVDVVYVDKGMKRAEWVPQSGPIRSTWLRSCAKSSLEEWKHHFPSVQDAELKATMVPGVARTYQDLALGKGLVTVELQAGGSRKGFANRLSDCQATVTELRDTLRNQMMVLQQTLQRELARVQEDRDQDRARIEVLEKALEKAKEEKERDTTQIVELTSEIQRLKAAMKKSLDRDNIVKKRVALTSAHDKLEQMVGRSKPQNDSWSSYFNSFSPADWAIAGNPKASVQTLLKEGARDFNDSIHNISPADVVGSIAMLQFGTPARADWEVIFFLAYGKTVTDQVFAVDVDAAIDLGAAVGI